MFIQCGLQKILMYYYKVAAYNISGDGPISSPLPRHWSKILNKLEAISRLNTITRLVKDESVQMLEGSRGIIQESKNLEMVTACLCN
jgi:hypothetical protein